LTLTSIATRAPRRMKENGQEPHCHQCYDWCPASK